ncbi:MAG: phosphate butyryltransferase [Prevotellaceae bacterium]|jgi:phosphate butyryltransferase|nr:phosphate butyryltransferase [Prevotellaceae bacterium]
MEPVKNFKELKKHLAQRKKRLRLAVANACDAHTLEAVVEGINTGFIEAGLTGNRAEIEKLLGKNADSPHIRFIDIAEPKAAAEEAVRLVKSGECDILMKGLVNTDVILRAILDKEKGLHSNGSVITYVSCFDIKNYHKMLFFSDPAVIPYPNMEQRIAMIKYAVATAQKFGVAKPKVALIHATEVPNPKIYYMKDYQDIMELYQQGRFGNAVIDGPVDIFVAVDKERGAIKKIHSHVLGDADVLIFPDFDSANVFYKTVQTFGQADLAGLLYGADVPVVLTSRSDSTSAKFYSLCMAAVLA